MRLLPDQFLVRPAGWDALSDATHSLFSDVRVQHGGREPSMLDDGRPPDVLWRGMEATEYDATLGAGLPIQSRGDYSFSVEGTQFSRDPGDAESYVNFGRSDPRRTGEPTYLVAVRADVAEPKPDGYYEAHGPVPPEAVLGVWRMKPGDDRIEAERVEMVVSNPKIVSLDPVMAATAGLRPNAPPAQEVVEAMADAPELLMSLGFEHPYDLDEQELGRGAWARAYLTPSGKVLKLTIDPTDAMVSKILVQEGSVPGLVGVEAVYRMPEKVRERRSDPEPRADLYAIVAERVRPLHQIWPPESGLPPSVTAEQSDQLKLAVDALAAGVSDRTGMSRHLPARPMEDTLAKAMEHGDRLGLNATGMQYLYDLVQGWSWMAEHGYRMGDLHTGNAGLTMDGRAVLLDLGMSADREASARAAAQMKLAANRGSRGKVDQVFDECFDVVEERFPDFGAIELYEDEAAGSDNGAGAERQFAYCMDGNPIQIAFAPKAESLPLNRLRGLMRHELGHALEFRYGVSELQRRLGRRLPEYSERRADVIAECVWNEPILYDSRNVQCVHVPGAKRRRPRGLPDKKEKLKPNTGTMFGYKAMRYEDGRAISGADSRMSFRVRKGETLTMPGRGIFLSTNRQYVMTYYAGHNPQEVFLTLEFRPSDVVSGRETMDDREPELTVREATIVDFEILDNEE